MFIVRVEKLLKLHHSLDHITVRRTLYVPYMMSNGPLQSWKVGDGLSICVGYSCHLVCLCCTSQGSVLNDGSCKIFWSSSLWSITIEQSAEYSMFYSKKVTGWYNRLPFILWINMSGNVLFKGLQSGVSKLPVRKKKRMYVFGSPVP